MRTKHSDLTTDLFEIIREAARAGTEQALAAHRAEAPKQSTMLLDKRSLAHALSVSTATIDRLVRAKRVPFVVVGQVRRFDLDAVRGALGATPPEKDESTRTPLPHETPLPGLRGVRLLSRRDHQ